jgi:mRNA-degrading endonuclease toxin of MazEF toxin-antitoxin module
MNVGDIVWVEFPQGAGRAQAGRRPAIIAQTAAASDRLPTVLLIPLTTQQDALRFPGTALVEPDGSNGLRHASVALVFQMTAVDRRFLGSRLGAISDANMEIIWTALHDITGL